MFQCAIHFWQVRRRKVEVLTQLPPKHRRTVVVKLSTEHAQQLAELKAELRRLDSADDESGWRSMSVFISVLFQYSGVTCTRTRVHVPSEYSIHNCI